MSDERLRELERRWRERASEQDEATYLLERARAGDDCSRDLLETAAFAGSRVAREALGRTPPRPTGFTRCASAAIERVLGGPSAISLPRFDLHLLVALLDASDAAARSVLEDLDLSSDRVVREARWSLQSELDWAVDRRPIAPARLLVMAHQERGRSAAPTGTTHLLLAILLIGRGEAAELLGRFGLVYWDTRQATLDLRAVVEREP